MMVHQNCPGQTRTQSHANTKALEREHPGFVNSDLLLLLTYFLTKQILALVPET